MTPATLESALDGIVSAVFARRCLVWAGEREWECVVAGRLLRVGKLAVGDRVRIVPEAAQRARVEALHPRSSVLSRLRVGRERAGKAGEVQVLAANLDQLLIVAAIREPPLRMRLVERFLVAAAKAGLHALVVVTKLDLDQRNEFPAVQEELAALGVTALGVTAPAVTGAAVTGTAVAGAAERRRPMPGDASWERLRAALAGRLSALVGHSGVGKTTLVNALADASLAVGEVDASRGRGRHITTTARLIPLPGGGGLIDSPGVREFALHDVTPLDLARHFPGLAEFRGLCRFPDCRHRAGRGCAVREALEAGRLDAGRYEGYLKLLDEVEREHAR